jgi:hypothetical protein
MMMLARNRTAGHVPHIKKRAAAKIHGMVLE